MSDGSKLGQEEDVKKTYAMLIGTKTKLYNIQHNKKYLKNAQYMFQMNRQALNLSSSHQTTQTQ